MRKLWIKVLLCGLFILLLSNLAVAKAEIMPLEDIEAGMQGVGRTVIQGTKIEEFGVEIVSTLENQNQERDLILVKTSGDVIERTGGIASGMSGSPVYIKGKLIGAIGYGWQMADHKIGMVTPIEDMLDIFKLEEKTDKENIILDTPIEVSGKKYKEIKFSAADEEVSDPHTLKAQPVTTPLLVDGITGRAKERLGEKLADFDLQPVESSGLVKNKEKVPLKPGSAVAAQLVRGDINVSAIGTLTYLDDDRLLAFGHPFLEQGNASYLLSSAYIHQMITSIKMPFKIGSPAGLKGIITQDRTAGLAGKVEKFPNVVPLEIEVVDNNLARSKTYNLQIIHDEKLLTKLSSTVLLQAIDTTIDRKGEGTAEVSIEIVSNDLDDNRLVRDNLYYSGSDIAANSLEDFMQVLGLLTNNPFERVNFANIKLRVEVSKKPRFALLEEVNLDKKELKPGEEVEAEIKFRPYRKELITKDVSLKVPEEVEEGSLQFYVLSGQNANIEQLNSSQNGNSNFQTNNIQNLKELVKIYQGQKQNNELVVQLKKGFAPQSQTEEKAQTSGEEREENKRQESYNNSLVEEVITTDYVLEGAVRKEVKIKTAEDNKENTETDNDAKKRD
ncbi:MAG: SpoIVB peptidase S55 domain-containing protein [Halanaerobacter sp.]